MITLEVTPGAYELENLDSHLRYIIVDKIKLEGDLTTIKCKIFNKIFVNLQLQITLQIY